MGCGAPIVVVAKPHAALAIAPGSGRWGGPTTRSLSNRDVSAPARLAFRWATPDDPATRVEITLEPAGDTVTRLRVAETRPLDMLDLVGTPLPGVGGRSFGPALVAG